MALASGYAADDCCIPQHILSPALKVSGTEDGTFMAWRIIGGLSGWLLSLAPLALVNALAFTHLIQPADTPLAGGAALLAGIALGGIVAGLLGGRRGGGWGGTVAGMIAGALFAGSLIGLMYLLLAQNVLPYLLALHPVRAMGAIGFVACILMIVAAGFGLVSGRRAERMAVEQMAAAQRTVRSGSQPRSPQQPQQQAQRPAHYSQPRDARDPRYATRNAQEPSRERTSRW